MWGNHLLDIYQHNNFNVSFPHDLTRNPTRLIQWQYWWWFWFSSVFILYYFLISKVILKRSLKFKPKIVTSYRSHGRWGDIVVAVIPIFWCLNILSHSTLLLRMSEFQTETNILTIRVRGRQWYWVYKMEINNFFSLSNKKIYFNGSKSITTATNYKGGILNIFEKHEMLRQYWRAWFQNKNILAYNNNIIKGELLTSETNLNDKDIIKKNKEWSLKTSKIKNTWYNKSLDSNSHFFQTKQQNVNKKFKFLYNEFFQIKNNFKNYNFSNNDNYKLKININNKNHNNYNFNKNIFKQINLNLFKFNHINNNNKTKNFNFLNEVNNIFNFNNLNFLNENNNLFDLKLNKLFLEFFKNNNIVYKASNLNINKIINYKNNYLSNKEPIKYTHELKPKFGYVGVKMELLSPIEFNLNLLGKFNLIALQPEMEYEYKNLDTTFKYYMVMDQHRNPTNRLFKVTKNLFSLKKKKILNGEVSQKQFKFINSSNSFTPIKVFKNDGTEKEWTFVNNIYKNLLIKSNFNFIYLNKNFKKIKLEDVDLFSPAKYNINTKFSAMQGNIKTKKKLIFNQRLLKTTSILVLPTSLNITVITNSYDVIHSWFIPGLGLKMDCVPGRSTHHTLYIDHAGLYYGQCAEICGRFHHHMPIKIAALQWEHFLLWWYHYTMNLGIHAMMKDYNKASLKELKNTKVYPITTKFIQNKPII